MIITKTPFRVSCAGGGSDIASFYEKHNPANKNDDCQNTD